MSQPRRRRRRRRRSGQSSEQAGKQPVRRETARQEAPPQRRARRRRGRRGKTQESKSPTSSEDLVRALPKEKPASLSLPPDGQSLDGIIGELQSVWGVPQYPQEYRITIKVAEEREGRGEQAMVVEEISDPEQGRAPGDTDVPIREKAPAAPLMRTRGQGNEGQAQRKRPRRRRRRGGRGGGAPQS